MEENTGALALERVASHRQASVTPRLALEVSPCLPCEALTKLTSDGRAAEHSEPGS